MSWSLNTRMTPWMKRSEWLTINRTRERERTDTQRRRRGSDGRVSEEDRSGGCAGLLREVHEKAPRSSCFWHRFRRTRCCFCFLASHRPHVGLDWVGGWVTHRLSTPHELQRERILVASLIHSSSNLLLSVDLRLVEPSRRPLIHSRAQLRHHHLLFDARFEWKARVLLS